MMTFSELYRMLREIRNNAAVEFNCPRYLILSDGCIRWIAQNRPKTLRDVPPIFSDRYSEHLPDFLNAIPR